MCTPQALSEWNYFVSTYSGRNPNFKAISRLLTKLENYHFVFCFIYLFERVNYF